MLFALLAALLGQAAAASDAASDTASADTGTQLDVILIFSICGGVSALILVVGIAVSVVYVIVSMRKKTSDFQRLSNSE